MSLAEVLILTTVEMISLLLTYIIVFGAKLRKNKIIIFVTYLLGIAFQIIVYSVAKDDWDSIITTIYWIVIPLFWLEKRKKKWFALYPFIYMDISFINVFYSFIASLVLNIPEGQIISIGSVRIVYESGSIILLLAILLYIKLAKKEIVEVNLSWWQYALLFLGIFSSAIIIGCVQMISSGEELNLKMQNANGFAVTLICVIFIIVCLWQGVITRQKMEYKNKTENYEKLMRIQGEQIHRIIDKDDRMRKFRHDMNSHLTALRGCVIEKDYDRMLEYLDEMENNSYVKKAITYTGDSAIDAILREYIGQAEERGIIVTEKIQYKTNNNIKIYDLCTIISNVLKNAIEACEKIETDCRKIWWNGGIYLK